MAGLSDFRKDLQPVEKAVMLDWVGRTQRRLHLALSRGFAVGGGQLAANAVTTAKIKGHWRPGTHRAKLLAAVEEGHAKINLGGRGATAAVHGFAASGAKVGTIFIKGVTKNLLRKRRGKKMAPGAEPVNRFNRFHVKGADGEWYTRIVAPVPARDFVGIAEADVDAVAEKAMTDVLHAWGFR